MKDRMGPGAAGAGAGLSLALLSAATFGTSGIFATGLLDAGWSAGAAVTVRVLIAAIALTVPAALALRRHRPLLRTAVRSFTVYGMVAVAGCQLAYFNAVEHLSVAVALLLEYSGVLLVVLWLWSRHGHRPRRLTMFGAVTALAGLVLVLDLAGNSRFDAVGLLWAAASAVGLAAYFVISSRTEEAMPPIVVAWGGLAVGGLVLLLAGAGGVLPLEATRADVVLIDTRVSWLIPVAGLSLVAAGVAYVAGITAARVLGAKLASFVGLSEVVFAVVFAWLVLDQRLTGVQLAGCALVVAGIGLVRLDELRPAEPAVSLSPVPAAGLFAAEQAGP